MIERSREDLELQLVEQRERIEYLEAQIASMLASAKYGPDSAKPRRVGSDGQYSVPPASKTYQREIYGAFVTHGGAQAAPWNTYPGD